ncbi:MAG: endopeptidase La, partial [Lachnospiraceae bacterium]|nr:endopeptidase La [Lachnospiraceae bacterium]
MAVLPVHNIIAVPDAVIYLKISMYRKLTGKTPKVDDRVTVIITKEDLHKEELKNDSFYKIGIAGTVTEVNENGYLVLTLTNRVDIREITVFMDHSIDIVVERRGEIE